MGYSKMQVALALDECGGDADAALAFLADSAGLGPPRPHPAPAAAPPLARAAAGKNCILCAADSAQTEGLTCISGDEHFVCNACFADVVKKQTQEGHTELWCPAPRCKSRPWPYAKLAQHLPDQVFGEFLSCRERKREKEFKQREGKLRAEASRYAPPSYWSDAPHGSQRWKVVPVSKPEWMSIAKVVALPPGNSLGGRDQRLAGAHSSFRLGQAWRIENPGIWAKYAAERERLKSAVAALPRGQRTPKAKLREVFWKALGHMSNGLDADVNELYLMHGTKPDILMSVVSGGLNERFSGGNFGHGTYFAEDLGKNDQYVTEDAKYGDHKELHKELYTNVRHPGKVYYVFLCRVAFGHYVTTKDARTIDGSGANLWSSAQRELAYIPGVSPPEPFHGLLAETGGAIQRYREFITFHGDRIYPEYLLAYHRC